MSSSRKPCKATWWRREERQNSAPPPQGNIWSWLQCDSYPRKDLSLWLSGMSSPPSALQSLPEADQIIPWATLCSPSCLRHCFTGCRWSAGEIDPNVSFIFATVLRCPCPYSPSTQDEMHANSCKWIFFSSRKPQTWERRGGRDKESEQETQAIPHFNPNIYEVDVGQSRVRYLCLWRDSLLCQGSPV